MAEDNYVSSDEQPHLVSYCAVRGAARFKLSCNDGVVVDEGECGAGDDVHAPVPRTEGKPATQLDVFAPRSECRVFVDMDRQANKARATSGERIEHCGDGLGYATL